MRSIFFAPFNARKFIANSTSFCPIFFLRNSFFTARPYILAIVPTSSKSMNPAMVFFSVAVKIRWPFFLRDLIVSFDWSEYANYCFAMLLISSMSFGFISVILM